jgi:small conductance mechanosensitive channel
MRLSLLVLAATLLVEPGLRAQAPKEVPPETAQRVEVNTQTPDQGIRQRILDVFSQVGEFEKIDVKVNAGVVTLSGEVSGAKTREEALALVNRTEGVVLALDRLTETTEVGARLSPAMEKLHSLGRGFMAKLPLIAIALGVITLFAILANFLHRRESWYARLRVSSLARNLARRLVRLTIVALGVIIALEILDATAIVSAVLGAAGLIGIAFGFAFKNILENYLSGILLSTRNPFDIGDLIEIAGKTGKVALLTSRDTVLVTPDGNQLRIPNSIVINSELVNFSRNPLRRFEFVAGISVNIDLGEAKRVGLLALAKNPAVLRDPEAMIIVEELGESTINLRFFAWIDQTKHDFLKARSQSIRLVKEAFDESGIEMPEPIYRVVLRRPGDESTAERSVAPPSVANRANAREIPPEDLSADDTIDKQMIEEQRLSQEENLLPEPTAAK